MVEFILGENQVYESSSYSGFSIGAALRYHISPGLFSAALNGEVRPSPSLGDAEQGAFGVGSGFGIGFGADARLTFLDHVELTGFYALRRYTSDFDGTGDHTLGAVSGTDTFQHLGARLSYIH